MRHDLFCAIIAKRQHRSATFSGFGIKRLHHRGSALGNGGKAVDADVHCHQEVVQAYVEIFAAQCFFVGETDRVDHKINIGPFGRQRVKGAVEIVHVGNVAIDEEVTAELFRQWPNALFHDFALIAERQFRAFGMQTLRNAPRQRLVIGEPHNQPAFARHQSSHKILIRQVNFVAAALVHFHGRWPALRLIGHLPPIPAQ